MSQQSLLQVQEKKFLNLKEASKWSTGYLQRNVTVSNISYLIQYGRIRKYSNEGKTLIKTEELRSYYDSLNKEKQWKKVLGDDLNWKLSFAEFKEFERTKHVHRLHPYKGKFIPQLVEYFLDDHTDEYKKEVFFHQGDIVLDPFCGSGTTLVQANELGIHAIGLDISAFNVLISNVKLSKYNLPKLKEEIDRITNRLFEFQEGKNNLEFEGELLRELSLFNNQYFPSPEYRRKVRNGEINEKEYVKDKEANFLEKYRKLVAKYGLKVLQERRESFLEKWYLSPVRNEIDILFKNIKLLEDENIKRIITIILSRAIRSCRATTHADLGTLKEPVASTYYCRKHGKICKPIFSIRNWWKRYSIDTINRLQEFQRVRTNTQQLCLTGDSRNMIIPEQIEKGNQELSQILNHQKISGIFSSPPYVGLINYHEQHAYSYELFGFERSDEFEIGPMQNGQGKEARGLYAKSIANVLLNCKKYLKNNYNIFGSSG